MHTLYYIRCVKIINWSKEKNAWLKQTRGIGFEDILFYVENGCLVDDLTHPNQSKYPDQRMMVIDINGYIYLVPYAEDQKEIFLKTIIPSRKATKQYLGKNHDR